MRRDREARAFGAVEHLMPSRQGDKNNRYLVGHAAYGRSAAQHPSSSFKSAGDIVLLHAKVLRSESSWKRIFSILLHLPGVA